MRARKPTMTGPPEVLRFARELSQLRENAGNPKYAAMGKRAADAGLNVAISSLSIADKGNHLPGWRVVQAYVIGCKGDPEQWADRWTEANAAVQGKEKPPSGTRPTQVVPDESRPAPPDPTTAVTPQQLRSRLQMLYERAGRPSLRDMEASATAIGLRLPRSTSQNLLRSMDAGALPRRDHLRAFLAVCGLPDDEHHEWVAVRDAIDERRRRRVQARRAATAARTPAAAPEAVPVPAPRTEPDATPAANATPEPAAAGLATDRDAVPAVNGPETPPPAPTPGSRRRPQWLPQRWLPRRWLRLRAGWVAVAAVLLFLLASSTVADRLGNRPAAAPPSTPRPTPTPLVLARAAPAARPTLLALIETARAQPAQPTSTTGRYTYIQTRIWSLDTTDPSAVSDPVNQHLWWAADGSARRVGIRVDTFGPGEFKLLDPPSTDPAILAGQFDEHQPLRNGPQSTIRAVADMYKQHPFNPDQIAAALRVLADTDGLVDRGPIIDRANRPGIAISVDSDAGATRDIAVFDPHSGALLSYERVALISPPRTPVRAPAVIAYVLYLKHGRTDQPA